MIRITITTGNAAFYDGGSGHIPDQELSRILRVLADEMNAGLRPEQINDINGNGVCTITYTGKDRP